MEEDSQLKDYPEHKKIIEHRLIDEKRIVVLIVEVC